MNWIVRLKNQHGGWCESRGKMGNVAVAYFQSLFTPGRPHDRDLEAILSKVTSKVSDKINSRLLQCFRADEVLLALSKMYPTKSLSPDGMPAIFF